ncbi:SDR family NAD(P)-dependent oxidoreductase [Neobacillus rhizophilus]|uniref:SDR family oxidoreductase n=1 Tax=Neobacillus rhizophilus TaxID=2833579 RepID=A0A942U8L8_9BACI|nr:SDR family oxidoreductase [Neobacillus rhizophilus]MBS4213484.1 SDR family oxidoreductase [Neobacillus rhizophilus]MBU8918106.1 SDR family oxidoreductase [Bacillus sp. FJAT-29953]
MKTIIITGGGSGLGKELALLFSQKGYHVVLAGRTVEKLSSVRNELADGGGNADVMVVDIRNREDVFSKVKELCGKYDVYGLVNNAGVGHFGPFGDMDDAQIVEMLDTNVLGTILMTKAVLPILLGRREGRIMNIISTAGLRGKVNEAVYCASKFAVRGFTESLQKEFEGRSIKINAVYMGGMDTPFWTDSDHVKDPSRLRSAREVAEFIMEQMEQDTIVIESKKG